MPDESPKPTTGNSPERNDLAPGWWDALGRADLPDDLGNSRRLLALPPGDDPPSPQRRTALVVLLSILVALALAAVAMVSLTPMRDIRTAALLFGAPALLAGIVAMAVVRHGG